jgi:crotonobetainyl-CoA:carnitine CoA-transferase CaiB-like acyl-CoA transferase
MARGPPFPGGESCPGQIALPPCLARAGTRIIIAKDPEDAMADGETTQAAELLPLAGLTVLDLTLVRAGPTCVRHLSDWGASVIRIEPPGAAEPFGGGRDGPDFQNLHRNKRTIQLDLKHPDGRAAFLKLVARADVLVENMRVRVKHRLKIAWEDLHAINPRLVYGSISGFGQTGPYAERPGFDQVAQGMGGLMGITGHPGQGPMRAGIAVADMTAGNLLAMGIMMALFERQRTGVGRWVHTSLLEAQIFMLDFQAARWLIRGEVAQQAGNDHPTGAPTGAYEASDGHINIAAGNEPMWRALCEVLGKPEWQQEEAWVNSAARVRDRARLSAAINEITRTRTAREWFDALEAVGIPAGPIYRIDQMFADPQVQHLRMARPVTHPRLGEENLLASALNFGGVEKDLRTPPPEAGEHTDEVLRELGYDEAEITRLRAEGVL